MSWGDEAGSSGMQFAHKDPESCRSTSGRSRGSDRSKVPNCSRTFGTSLTGKPSTSTHAWAGSIPSITGGAAPMTTSASMCAHRNMYQSTSERPRQGAPITGRAPTSPTASASERVNWGFAGRPGRSDQLARLAAVRTKPRCRKDSRTAGVMTEARRMAPHCDGDNDRRRANLSILDKEQSVLREVGE